ncbi:MAG: hypothetical protein ACLTSL_09245 [Odoribacter splanchnicus]
MEQLTQEILRLCRMYGECRVEVERREEARKVRNALEKVCAEARQDMDIADPALLVALLEACEVTRDEGMLQEVLDVVGGNLERLAVSAESAKLLAYCYYYVEEEECLVRAGEMVEKLREEGEDVGEVEQVVGEMVGGKKVKSKK